MKWTRKKAPLKLTIGPWTIRVRREDTVPSIEWWEWTANTGERLHGFKSERLACKSAEEWLRGEIAELAKEVGT